VKQRILYCCKEIRFQCLTRCKPYPLAIIKPLSSYLGSRNFSDYQPLVDNRYSWHGQEGNQRDFILARWQLGRRPKKCPNFTKFYLNMMKIIINPTMTDQTWLHFPKNLHRKSADYHCYGWKRIPQKARPAASTSLTIASMRLTTAKLAADEQTSVRAVFTLQ
jgi:hypothetical protein